MTRKRLLTRVTGTTLAGIVLATTMAAGPTAATTAAPADGDPADTVRFATFNVAMFGNPLFDNEGGRMVDEDQMMADLSTQDDPEARKVAEVIQHIRPDVLLVNEFDYVPDNAAVDAFRSNYLRRSQNGAEPIDYPYAFTAPVNSGVPTGFDLDRDGATDGPRDAQGSGSFEGQMGMLVLSKYPIDTGGVRTFQRFRWKDMPDAMLPSDPDTPEEGDWYSKEILDVLRLSSRSHWDVPIRIGRSIVHLLGAHATPPVFDGPENSNGTRNNDQIRFWADYVTPGEGDYIYDDEGIRGGLRADAKFVVAGDYNSDPLDGDSVPGSIDRLLDAPRVVDTEPRSDGAVIAAEEQGGANEDHEGDPALDTGDFSPANPGNLRVDYVLPSRPLRPVDSAVFWPTPGDPLSRLNDASDHHLVWLDVAVPDRVEAPR